MKKILFVLNSNSYSGAENVVIQIISHLDPSRYTGIYTSPDGDIRNVLEKKQIAFEPMEKLSVSNLKAVIKKVQPDLIHANDFTAACIAALCRPRAPIVAHIHNNSSWIKGVNSKTVLFALCSLRCMKILIVSDSVYNEFIFRSAISGKTLCIGNPVDISGICGRADENANKEYDIIVLGRLTEAKNPVRALEIIREVNSKKGLRAVFIGDGELRAETENKVRELGLSETVDLAGFQSNPYEYIVKSKVMLMPSSWEGFGLAAVEALAYGVPVVASAVGGLPDIVNEGCGKICRDNPEFVSEIQKLLEDPAYYAKKRAGAFTRSREMDNAKKYFDRIQQIYDDIIKD